MTGKIICSMYAGWCFTLTRSRMRFNKLLGKDNCLTNYLVLKVVADLMVFFLKGYIKMFPQQNSSNKGVLESKTLWK